MDIGFTRFISNTWISFIWVVVIIAHFLGTIGAIFYAFHAEEFKDIAVLSLFVVPLIALVSILFCRMFLELDVVLFRIESNTRETRDLLREIKEQLAKE